MHHLTAFHQSLAIAASNFVAAIAYGILGIRNRRCDPPYARAFFVTASVAVVIGLLVLFQIVSPVIGYSLLCLALAGFQLADLLQDEHARARQRRIALLAPRPAAEVVPTVWVSMAIAAGLMVAPYVILDKQRVAAAIVAICAFVMAAIAWRASPARPDSYSVKTFALSASTIAIPARESPGSPPSLRWAALWSSRLS